ncbi:hypothetical protein ACLKA6_008518 [Drosophila palustris]
MPKRGGATGACNSPGRVMEVAAESADQQAEKPMTARPTAATITREHRSYSEVTSAESFAVLPKSPLLNKGAIQGTGSYPERNKDAATGAITFRAAPFDHSGS